MKERRTLKCSCSQTTYLVRLDDGWHFDEQKHGNGELARGRCFNCQAVLEPQAPPEQKGPPAPLAKPEPANGPEATDLSELSKKKLVSMARELGIAVPKKTGKPRLIELITQAQQPGA